MNRYYVKIDGQEAPESYTYEELRSMGVLDFDDIQVRKMLDSNWYSAKYYNFPESSSTPDIEIDEYGQIRNSPSRNNIQIDEPEDAPIYNLNGQRMDKPHKGLKIIGGKKIIVK